MAGSGSITGTGGGGFAYNHGIYRTPGTTTLALNGTAGSGTGSLPVAP